MSVCKQPSDKVYKEESTLLAKVVEWLEPQRRDGIKVIRVVDRYHKGYSDLFISAKGRFVVAELKDDEGTATPHQEIFIEEMNATGAVGGICRSVKDVQDLIDKALYCTCLSGGKITVRVPAFEAMAICNQHLNHGPLDIVIPFTKYCPDCGKQIKR
jgi:hypothetical protein